MVLKPSKSRVPFLISLFNFQGPIAILSTIPSRRQLKEYITSDILLSILLKSFFNFFILTFSLPSDISAGKLVYIITSFCFCQLFFETFFNIFHNSFCFCTLFRVNLVLFYKNTTKYSVPLCGVLVTTIYGGITESIYKSKTPP